MTCCVSVLLVCSALQACTCAPFRDLCAQSCIDILNLAPLLVLLVQHRHLPPRRGEAGTAGALNMIRAFVAARVAAVPQSQRSRLRCTLLWPWSPVASHLLGRRQLWGNKASGPLTAPPREARAPVARGRDSAPPLPPARTWIDKVPGHYQPYLLLARADKPIGTWLLLWPCCWSIGMVAPPGGLPDMWMLSKFALGAVVMRGAGCTINDMWDKDIDSKVERTRTRPLAAGAITPFQAAGFLGLQLTAGLGILASLNTYSILLGASSLGLVVMYPLMKRVTHFPQLVLGLTFNWGALLGASAVLGHTPWEICLPLYCGSVFWTLTYDTIYAHQDKADDCKVGVKSTALYFGDDNTKVACSVWAACFIAGLAAAGQAAGLGVIYNGAIGAAAAHLGWQIASVHLNTPADCMAKFVSNKRLGAIVFAGIAADKLLLLEPALF